MVSVSAAIDASGNAYFDALRDSQGLRFSAGVNAAAFVEYHTLRLLDAANSLRRRAERSRHAAEAVAAEFGMELRDVWLSAYLAEFAAISSSTYARLVNVSQTTATKHLNEWVRGRALERVGGGRNTRYRSSQGLREAVARYDATGAAGDR
jgi:Fic family protein